MAGRAARRSRAGRSLLVRPHRVGERRRREPLVVGRGRDERCARRSSSRAVGVDIARRARPGRDHAPDLRRRHQRASDDQPDPGGPCRGCGRFVRPLVPPFGRRCLDRPRGPLAGRCRAIGRHRRRRPCSARRGVGQAGHHGGRFGPGRWTGVDAGRDPCRGRPDRAAAARRCRGPHAALRRRGVGRRRPGTRRCGALRCRSDLLGQDRRGVRPAHQPSPCRGSRERARGGAPPRARRPRARDRSPGSRAPRPLPQPWIGHVLRRRVDAGGGPARWRAADAVRRRRPGGPAGDRRSLRRPRTPGPTSGRRAGTVGLPSLRP